MNRSDIDTSIVDYCLSNYEQSLFMSDNIVNSCSIESCIEDVHTLFDISDSNDSSESDSTFMSNNDSDLSQGNDSTFSDEEINGSDTNFQFNRLKDGLSLYYTNADNLLFKLDELKVRIQLVSPDILIITEIYPKMGKSTDITEDELHIDNYSLFRSNVKESSRGVAIYVKDTLSSTINLDLTDHLFSESVWVNIHINDKDNFLIGGVYRSPQSSIENSDLL